MEKTISSRSQTAFALLAGWILFFIFANVKVVQASKLIVNTNPDSVTVTPSGISTGTWQNTSNTPSFTWSGATGDIAGYFIYWGNDSGGTSVSAQNPSSNTTYSPAAVSDGTYYLRVNTQDTTESDPDDDWVTLFTFRYDSTPPVTNNVTADEQNEVISDIWQGAVDSPSFTVSGLSDLLSGTDGYLVYFGDQSDGTSSNFYPGEPIYFSPPSPLQEGTYYLRICGRDIAGNESEWKTVFTFRLDLTTPENVSAPAVESHSLASDVWQNSIHAPSFSWNTAANASQYLIYWGPDSNGTSMDAVSSTEYTPGEVSSSSVMYLRVRSVDTEGHTSSEWRTLFIFKSDFDQPDPVSEVTEANALPNRVCQTDTRSVSFSWDVPGDVGSGIRGYLFSWSSDAEGTSENLLTQPAFTPEKPAKAGAKLYLRLASLDNAGNVSSWNTVFVFCHADGLVTVLSNQGSSDPETFYDVGLTLSSGQSISLHLSSKSAAEDYYARIWYPENENDHTSPSGGYSAPVGYQSFFIGFDYVGDCSPISALDSSYLITMSYRDPDILALEQEQLGIYRLNQDGNWVILPSSSQDPVDHTVTAEWTYPGEVNLLGVALEPGRDLSILAKDIDFGSIPLTGKMEIRTGVTEPWIILNATYSAVEWYVTLQADDFKDAEGHILSIQHLSVQIPGDRIQTLVSVVSPVAPPQSLIQEETLLSNNTVHILESTAQNSTGKYQVEPVFILSIPAETYKGTYQNKITVTIVRGP